MWRSPTIAESARLPMPELERKFRLAESKYKAWNVGGYFVLAEYEDDAPMIADMFGGYLTEEEAWENCPPISNDEWLEAMDMLWKTQAGQDALNEAEGSLWELDAPRSEILKRAVLAAYIFTHQ